jgi:micrococcal nuclease
MKKKEMRNIIALIVFLIGAYQVIIAPQASEEKVNQNKAPLPTVSEPTAVLGDQTASASVSAQVIRVVDGDTVRVLINGEEKTLRLIGLNTPETVDPRREVQCYGKEASNKAKELLTDQTVYLESDDSQGETDKYQRLLRYIWLTDGRNFNKLMITEGYAYEYTYDLPYKYQSEFKTAQLTAQETKKGLWSDTSCGGKTSFVIPTEMEGSISSH